MESISTYFGWWCMGNKNENGDCESYPGKLEITNDKSEFRLTILGNPKELEKNFQEINEQEFYPVIIGVAKNSQENKDTSFTLLNSTIIGYRSSTLEEVRLSCQEIIQGYQIEDINSLKIRKISISVQFLEEWIGVSGFSKIDNKSLKKFNAQYNYKVPDPIYIAKTSNANISIQFSWHAPIFPLRRDVTISEKAFVVIDFLESQSFMESIQYIEKTRNFFTLALGESISLNNTYLYKESKEELDLQPKFEILRKENKKLTAREKIREDQMLLPFNFLRSNCSDLLDRWIRNYEKYKHALNLYFGTVYGKSQYEENAFLDIVYAIEVLHRIQNPEFDGRNDKYQKKLDGILSQLLQNDKNWLAKRLKQKHEKTLLNRFEDIYNELSPIVEMLFDEVQVALECIVTTRNYLVHYDILADFEEKKIPLHKLYRYTNKLTVLFQAMIIYYLTNNLDLVLQRIDKTSINDAYIRYKKL